GPPCGCATARPTANCSPPSPASPTTPWLPSARPWPRPWKSFPGGNSTTSSPACWPTTTPTSAWRRWRRRGPAPPSRRPSSSASRLTTTGPSARRAPAPPPPAGTPRAVVPVLLAVLAEDSDNDVQVECAASVEQHLAALGGYGPDLPRPGFALLKEAHQRVGRFRAGLCPSLLAWLEERVNTDVDVELLKTFGTVLTLDAQAGKLPRAYEVDVAVEDVCKVLRGDPPRAAVLVGESGSGKTAIVYELAHRLARDPDGPWCLLRVSPAEFLAGTVYLGEWETKLRNLINAAHHPRRVILYVPNLEELASIGVTSKSDSNVATALAPHIERGDVAILGESTAESFRKGLGAIRSLRRLFHSVQVPPTEPEETRDILRAVADDAGVEVADPVLDRMMELADYYVAGTAQPGRTVGLLRRVLGAVTGESGPVTERHVLNTISTSTGIPVDF